MSNKTPFEIRLELLKMAREMLESEYFSNREVLITEWNAKVSSAMENKETLPPQPQIPSFPSTQDVIEKASVLNGFVSRS